MGSNVIFRYDWPIKPQNFCPWLVKSSQSNFNLRSPDCYWVCSYLITTVIHALKLSSVHDDIYLADCHFSDDICFLSECRYWEWTNIGATNNIKNKSHVRRLLQFLDQNFGHGIVSIWGFNFSKWLYLSGNPKIGEKTTSHEMYTATKRRNQKCQRCGKLYCYCRSIKMIGIQRDRP